jgi:Sodium/hydrogen exchanger family
MVLLPMLRFLRIFLLLRRRGGCSAVSLLGSAHRTAEGLAWSRSRHCLDQPVRRDHATTGRAGARKLLPDVVPLLVAGVLTGPNVLGLASSDEAIELLHELGPGMLFLLAGYEVELKELTGRGGRRAMVTWLICVGRAG